MTEKQEITPQLQLFLDALFDGNTIRHPDEAKVMAGYPADYPWLKIIERCREALIEKYDHYLTFMSAKGMMGLIDVMENPQTPGSAVKLKAVIELLNRGGVTAKQSKEVAGDAANYVFVLPSKINLEQ
jgi:hypothetical protein